MKIDISFKERFEHRHNAPGEKEISEMLTLIGAESVDQLIEETVPEHIRMKGKLSLPPAQSEHEFLKTFRTLASGNKVYRNFIGMGYYNCFTPPVIQRNILENPGWYTAYTPYQAEIAQGRLEALINFQTMVIDLTGMEIANASLLDEGTAAGEAMYMLANHRKGAKKAATKFFADERCFPQTLDVLKSRTRPLGLDLVIGKAEEADLGDPDLFGILIQYPDGNGAIKDHSGFIEAAHTNEVPVVMAADLLSLTMLTSPGEMGADIVVGSTQRFGVPMGFGGPHAGYFATLEKFKRNIPGRIIGISKDKHGNDGYRMALQTREQHIRREKATSNICTAQVLLGVMAGMYAVYHGPDGLRRIAGRTHGLTKLLAEHLTVLGFSQENEVFFDTIKIACSDEELSSIRKKSEAAGINFRYFGSHIGISLDETASLEDVNEILSIFAESRGTSFESLNDSMVSLDWPENLVRKSTFMDHPVFHSHHCEHELLRYMKKLENRDLSLVHSMISLGSCTMKLNSTAEMIPVTWQEFGGMHPFAPTDQTNGYQELFRNLEAWLSEITGFAATSLQPNSGAQGEFAGLMAIKAYHDSRGDGHRDVTLIPKSAHGTNPASAVMAGTRVVIVGTDDHGNIDLKDLKAKAEEHKDNLAALMVTYPSTHGVYEEAIQEICEIIHSNGGQVYMDGANMNAQVGLTSPAIIGADVCHLNLHKTFCIPHGGGGPGVGPICVAEHLQPFLPGNAVVPTGGDNGIHAISAAPWGSASILPISYAYIAMMGAEGLENATKMAILNGNYIKTRLDGHYDVLYTGSKGRCAHEMIIDCRNFKTEAGVEVEDIAKRLMDYGFHAPTVSFPVPGTMMIEPTESEPKAELDRFCDAMISIREEIAEIANGEADPSDNVLKNAPHTIHESSADEWNHQYSREKAVFPLEFVKENKFWPAVSRIDNAYGDRNLVCACLPVEEYVEQ